MHQNGAQTGLSLSLDENHLCPTVAFRYGT